MEIQIQYRVSARAKRLRIAVHQDGRVEVVVPKKMSARIAERFVHSRRTWIEEKVAYFRKRLAKRKAAGVPHVDLSGTYTTYKEKARALAKDRVEHFNAHYNFTYGTIAIRNQQSRWGSCSKKGNLNFNYKIALLPAYLSDYIVVHELCHLGEFNHSAKFWALVAETMPAYKEMKKELREIGMGS